MTRGHRDLLNEADEHVNRARDLARDSLKEARRSVYALRPKSLGEGSLCDALANAFRKITSGTNLKSEFAILGEQRSLSPEREENLFYIGQEIITNTLRHAHAGKFVAKIIFAPGEVRFSLRDDGRGFDPSKKNDGFGLVGMKERVEAMGGQITLRSVANEGTSVLITLPETEHAQAQSS
jgi:signal transduction histidine kinase